MFTCMCVCVLACARVCACTCTRACVLACVCVSLSSFLFVSAASKKSYVDLKELLWHKRCMHAPELPNSVFTKVKPLRPRPPRTFQEKFQARVASCLSPFALPQHSPPPPKLSIILHLSATVSIGLRFYLCEVACRRIRRYVFDGDMNCAQEFVLVTLHLYEYINKKCTTITVLMINNYV